MSTQASDYMRELTHLLRGDKCIGTPPHCVYRVRGRMRCCCLCNAVSTDGFRWFAQQLVRA